MSSRAYRENYKAIKWAKRPEPLEIRAARGREANAPYYMPDIKEFVSPMSGKVLSSRKQVAHEERGYGVKQCGELKEVSDFDNTARTRERTNDRALETAFRTAVQQVEQRNPNIRWND